MTSRLQFSGRTRAAALAVATSALVATAGLAAGPAQSAPTSQCPTPYPVADLVKGAAVTGLTVTSGTEPDTFGGSVVGVLEDGIGPGVDMVLVDLTSTVIDKVGIWSGMSGSPVYASDGTLIGAVSYSLGTGPSTIAGVTPAAEMDKLLATGSSARVAAPQRTVALPRSLRARLARTGATTSATAPQTMHQMQVPLSISGLSAQRRATAGNVLRFGRSPLVDAPSGPASSEAIPITAGGNLAAAMSYGAVTIAGVGTATAVCGSEILGFGHPMNFSGPATMTLHGARATHIQDDPTLSGFKSANIGAPIGTVDGDRLAGLHAVTGALPTRTPFTSVARVGSNGYTARSYGSVPDVTPQLGFSNLVTAQDKVMDRVGKGSDQATWTIKGTRRNGTPFTFTRRDLYADSEDVSAASGYALASDLEALQDNPGETVKITSVSTSSSIVADDAAFVVQKVQVRRAGKWVSLKSSRPGLLRPGGYNQLKVFLTSRAADPRTVTTSVWVPKRARNHRGVLDVLGGQEEAESAEEYFDYEDFFEATPAPTAATFPQVLKELTSAPRHNQIQVTVRFPGAPTPANKAHTSRSTLDHVVLGHLRLPVVGRR